MSERRPTGARAPLTTVGERPLKLHLGCGERYLAGYVNIDFPPSEHTVQEASVADVHADLTQLVYPPESVAEIRLHHVFEHFDRGTALRLLIDWHEWLQVGGSVVLETPDFNRSARAALLARTERGRAVALRHIFGSQEATWAVHKDGWYAKKFKRYLSALGFEHVRVKKGSWRGTFNITATARKARPCQRDQQLRVAEGLLRESLVDDSDSELRLLDVWLQCLHREAGTAG